MYIFIDQGSALRDKLRLGNVKLCDLEEWKRLVPGPTVSYATMRALRDNLTAIWRTSFANINGNAKIDPSNSRTEAANIFQEDEPSKKRSKKLKAEVPEAQLRDEFEKRLLQTFAEIDRAEGSDSHTIQTEYLLIEKSRIDLYVEGTCSPTFVEFKKTIL